MFSGVTCLLGKSDYLAISEFSFSGLQTIWGKWGLILCRPLELDFFLFFFFSFFSLLYIFFFSSVFCFVFSFTVISEALGLQPRMKKEK